MVFFCYEVYTRYLQITVKYTTMMKNLINIRMILLYLLYDTQRYNYGWGDLGVVSPWPFFWLITTFIYWYIIEYFIIICFRGAHAYIHLLQYWKEMPISSPPYKHDNYATETNIDIHLKTTKNLYLINLYYLKKRFFFNTTWDIKKL